MFEDSNCFDDIDSDPVEYCEQCLSLRIIEEEGIVFCDECGSMEIASTNIRDWEARFCMPVNTIRRTPQHRYQLLTKRADRMAEYFLTHDVPQNAWLGVTVEAKTSKPRIDCLRVLDAPIRFLSCEPLIEDLGELDLTNIDWVIVGGESGPQARPMKEEWVLNIKRQTEAQGAAFFFKQWGTWGADGVKRNKHKNGKMIEGKVLQAMPM